MNEKFVLFPVSHMCGGATKEHILTAQELVTDWQTKWCRYRYSTEQDIAGRVVGSWVVRSKTIM